MKNLQNLVRRTLLGACLVLAACAGARAQSVDEFWRGKQLKIIVGTAAGGAVKAIVVYAGAARKSAEAVVAAAKAKLAGLTVDGKALSDAEILRMNYYVEGVQGSLPF